MESGGTLNESFDYEVLHPFVICKDLIDAIFFEMHPILGFNILN